MIKKADINEFRAPATVDVKKFMSSDWEACEVDYSHYAGIRTAATAYSTAAKKLGADIYVTERKGKLFLLKK